MGYSVSPLLRVRFLHLLLLVLAGCSTSLRRWDLVDQPVGCDEANRLAFRTLTALRYRVAAVEPASATQRGVLTASRSGSDGEEHVTVTIDCGPAGVTLAATRDGLLAQQMDTRKAFHNTFLGVRANAAAEDEAARQQRAGTAPADRQRGDLQVAVTPLPGAAARLEFPVDLGSAGLLAVRIEITNLSDLTYTLDPDAVRLTGADRRRAAPLPAAEAAARLASGPGSLAALQDAITSRALTAGDIPPGAQRRGYLYFPLADYSGATVVLTERDSGESEGVRVEF